MQYRRFGKLDGKVSALGFGCMRFPTLDGNALSAHIDEPAAIEMLRHAVDNGVNYLDTAYPYHEGRSEVVVGKALQDGYRDKVRLATKLPVWLVNTPSDFDKLLNEQLEKLATDHIDFYLLHALDKKRWHNIVLKQDLLARAEAALKDGRIRHLGFSIHDDTETLAKIIDGSDLWSFCQIQYNYMDIENQVGTQGLKLAANKGLAVVVMEPLLGGRLADPPKNIRSLFEQHSVRRTPAAWAFQWIWDQPEVSVVLSGMSTMAQVNDNLGIADGSGIGSFSQDDQETIATARELYRARTVIPCTKCSYCMPCPTGINIPANFEVFNHAHLFDDLPAARLRYKLMFTDEERSTNCAACGTCENLCPQRIPISEWMPKVSALLA